MKTTTAFLLLLCSVVLLQCAPKPQSIDNSFISFDQSRIAFTDEGEGQTVLLLHGFISSGNSWNKSILKKQLVAAGYRVIVPDMRGNGLSDKSHEPKAYQNNAEVKDLIALMDHLQIKQYMAIGYSRGSIVLAKLLTMDGRIRKAVLGGMGLDFTNPEWDRRILFAKAFGGKTPLDSLTEGAVNYAKSIGADTKALSLLQEYQPVTSIAELNRIRTHTLVIAGDQDQDNGLPADLQAQLPNSQLSIIPGDHNNTYKGLDFATTIMKFFE